MGVGWRGPTLLPVVAPLCSSHTYPTPTHLAHGDADDLVDLPVEDRDARVAGLLEQLLLVFFWGEGGGVGVVRGKCSEIGLWRMGRAVAAAEGFKQNAS